MLIDDAWASIGSCNLHSNSMYGHTEMNVSFRDAEAVMSLRRQLLSEHLGRDTAQLDDREALLLYREIARENRQKRENGDDNWSGLAYLLDPKAYGE